MLLCVLEQDGLLVLDGVALALVCILLGEAAIESRDFISCPLHFCVLLQWGNCQYRIGCFYCTKIPGICHSLSSIFSVNFSAMMRSIFRFSGSVPS